MADTDLPPSSPRFGIGTIVVHPTMGHGRIVAYEGDRYVIVFKGGEVRSVAFGFEGLTAQGPAGDPELDRIRQVVREALGEAGWLDVELELGRRWVGGTLRLIPGKADTQAKDVPIDTFFKKLVGVRDRLRVLEQKVNSHPALSGEEKLELQGYITRCYGSLTTFNLLFGSRPGQLKGQGDREDD